MWMCVRAKGRGKRRVMKGQEEGQTRGGKENQEGTKKQWLPASISTKDVGSCTHLFQSLLPSPVDGSLFFFLFLSTSNCFL